MRWLLWEINDLSDIQQIKDLGGVAFKVFNFKKLFVISRRMRGFASAKCDCALSANFHRENLKLLQFCEHSVTI